MSLREVGTRAGLLAAGVLVAGLLGEGLCWFLGLGAPRCQPVPPAPVEVMEPFYYRLPPNYAGELECPRSAWNRPGFSVELRTNSHGFRDLQRPLEKPPGTTRILLLGDSFAMGFAVARERALAARLEQILGDAYPERRFEVVNTGVWGTNTEMEANLLASIGRRYAPELILVVYVLNDAELEPGQPLPGDPPEPDPRAKPSTSRPPGWLARLGNGLLDRGVRWSRLVRTGYDVWRWQILGKERSNMTRHHGRPIRDYNALYGDDSPGWQSVQRGMAMLARIAGEEKIPAAVVIFPMMIDLSGDYPYQKAHDKVTAAAREVGLLVQDLRPAFAGHEGREFWVTAHDNHPDEVAHGLAAEATATWLRQAVLNAEGSVAGTGDPVAVP